MGATRRERTPAPADIRLARRSRPGSSRSTGPVDVDRVLSLQRTAGNAAVSALLGGGTRPLQRNHESGALLKTLAKPKVLEFSGKEIEVQKEIVNKFEGSIVEQRQRVVDATLAETEHKAKTQELMDRYFGEDAPEMDDEREAEAAQAFMAVGDAPASAQDELDKLNRWTLSVLSIGAIELNSLPESDEELLRDAKLIDLKSSNSLQQSSAFNLVEESGMTEKVVANTLNTMIKAGQIDYLRKSGVIGDDWKVLIEVHYYRSRDQVTSQFHKDTLGQTLFVNLNYHIDQPIAGPEYLLHPPTVATHESQIAKSLPPEFLSDLTTAGEGAQEATHIEAPEIPAYGAVAFVDELIHHMTPLRGHRPVTGADLGKYLDEHHSQQTQGESLPNDVREKLREMSHQSATTYTRPDLRKAGMRNRDISKLLAEYGPSGFRTVSIPGATPEKGGTVPIERRSKAPLKRRMSWKAKRNELPKPVGGDRRFFRTWVRAVRKT
jgi:hypothetical protein